MLNWPLISAEDALARLQKGATGVDVRSRGEAEQGAMPGFVNLPILNDEHRHEVGLCYKLQGQAAAVDLGFRLVSPLRSSLIAAWNETLLRAVDPEQRLLICWRGGMRSQITAEWLAEAGVEGVRVLGGYKALRHQLMSRTDRVRPEDLIVISGMTGAGKTEFLQRFKNSEVIDLEASANHRGSAFGAYLQSAQPSQQTFENRVGLALLSEAPVQLIEAESRMIGSCCVPAALMAAMEEAPVVILNEDLESRARRIYREYVEEPLAQSSPELVKAWLSEAVNRIAPRLGGALTASIRTQMAEALTTSEPEFERHSLWIEALLELYYDPRYVRSLREREKNILFRGNREEAFGFLRGRLGQRGY